MKVPSVIRTYCPRCKAYTEHSVSLYKHGRRSKLRWGERRHEEDKHGYGGQKYPIQRRFAKTTKKQTLKLVCKVCGYTRQKKGIRLKKLVIE